MAPFEVWASPEPTVARVNATTFRDQLAETGHEVRESDLDLLAGLGVRATRYPVLWEKCALDRYGTLDFSWARLRLERLRELRIEPIVTLLHHGSGPRWTNLVDPAFPELFSAYADAVARAFPWVERWTPINEPLTTARFATLYGWWYPNTVDDDETFGQAITNEALAMLLAMERIRAHAPRAQFVFTEDLQSFPAHGAEAELLARHLSERMYLSVELVMGRIVPGHPLFDYLTGRCNVAAARLAQIAERATTPDLLGWNYYPDSEQALTSSADGRVHSEPARRTLPISPRPLMLAAYERIGLPFGISEVHCNGDETTRLRWFNDRAADLDGLAADGLPVRMLGAWAAFGMVDWDSVLRERRDHREDGVFSFAGSGQLPKETAVAAAVRALAARGSAPGS